MIVKRPRATLASLGAAPAFWRFLIVGFGLVLLLAIAGGNHGLHAQPVAPGQQQPATFRIDQVKAELDKAEATLREYWQTDTELLALKAEVDALMPSLQSSLDELRPQLEASKKRLDQLGPKPGEKDPPESEAAAKQRVELTKEFDAIDEQVKRASLQQLRIQQLNVTIINQRRELLLRQMFQRSYSALNPLLWYDAARAVPENLNTGIAIASTWGSIASAQLTGARFWQFFTIVLALIAVYFPLRLFSRRVIARQAQMSAPPRLQKLVAAVWITLVLAIVPVGIAMLIAETIKLFDITSPGLQTFIGALVNAVQIIAITVGLTGGLLAPGRPEWRLLDLSDASAWRLAILAVSIASIVAALRIFEVITDLVGAPLVLSVAIRVIGTMSIAIVLAIALYRGASVKQNLDCEFGPVVEHKRDWFSIWRLLAGVAVVAITLANIFGFINFANFVVSQLVWVTFLMIGTYLLLGLLRESIERFLLKETVLSKSASDIFGIRQASIKQVAILLEGGAQIVIYISAAMLLLAPWGVESDSVVETLRAVFSGFSVGAMNFSLAAVAVAIALFVIGYLATRAFQNWLDRAYLPNTQLDAGLRNSIVTSAGYVGIIAAFTLPFAYLGFNFEKLAIVAGALSLGIGFGLQSIVSNFVSGLILLWERAIKVGDWVVVGTDQGLVRRINVRSTEIETFDRQMVIVPNSNLISGVVKNWVRTDKLGRIIIPVGVSYDSDPDKVREVLLQCAGHIEGILDDPKPTVLFTDFADSSLNFELRCFVSDVGTSSTARSDLRFEILRAFREAKIEIPFPQRDLNLRDVDKIIDTLAAKKPARKAEAQG
jgi:potassium-dependent mechanosensitive channel